MTGAIKRILAGALAVFCLSLLSACGPAETPATEKDETEMNTGTKDGADPRAAAVRPTAVLAIEANGRTFYAVFEKNGSAEALKEKLSSEALTLELHDYGNFEKVGELPWELPRDDRQITTVPGDVILYQGNQITVYYDENTWNFTKLAHIGNVTKEELLKVFGSGNVTVTFSVEWGE